MTKLNKSILDAISSTIPEKDKLNVTENRGSHAIASAVNFIHFLKENYSEEESAELIKRFINSVKTDSPEKFYRGLQHIKEGKTLDKKTDRTELDDEEV